jgi:hypothetical protein
MTRSYGTFDPDKDSPATLILPMRPVPLKRGEPSLQERLSELDAQLRTFEASLRSHQQSHTRIRSLESELASIVEQGAALVRDLDGIKAAVQRSAETAAREAATPAADTLKAFEDRGQRLLEAYAEAVRAAQQAVARAEARIDAFDERVARELAEAGRQIREAAELLRQNSASETVRSDGRIRTIVPAVIGAVSLALAAGVFLWSARAVRNSSDRADAAERALAGIRNDANQQVASMQQKSGEIAAATLGAERLAAISAAPDVRRLGMRGYGGAASATGQALWSPSHGLAIVASGLPAVSDADTYQVWVVAGGDIVSLGTIAPDRSGRLIAVFDPPAAPRTVKGFMITRERLGGAPRPSAAVVLAT